MARPKGSTRTPGYCLHKATGQAYVTIAGKVHYLGKHGTRESRSNYDRLIGEWLSAGRPLTPDAFDGSITITELVALHWVKLLSRKWSTVALGRKSLHPRLVLIRSFYGVLTKLYGDCRVKDFGPLKLQAVVDEMKKQKCSYGFGIHEERTWSRAYVNMGIMVICSLFKWAVANELAGPHQHHALMTVPLLNKGDGGRETERKTAAADEDVEAVIAVAKPQMAAMIRLHRITGMRSSEMLMMRPCDIDMTSKAADGTPCWLYRPSTHKNAHRGHHRVIPLGPVCQELIRPFLPTNLQDFIFKPARNWEERNHGKLSKTRTAIWLRNRSAASAKRNRFRERFDASIYGHAVLRLCRIAAAKAKAEGRRFTPWHPHQLRHAAATEIGHQHGKELAQAVLGHKTIAQTEDYMDPDVSRSRDLMARIG